MNSRVKELIHQGDIRSLKSIFEDEKTSHSRIEAITPDDFKILLVTDKNPRWEHAGFGSNLHQPFDPNYRYEMCIDGKLVERFKRVPVIGAYDECFEFVNNIREKCGLEPLKNIFLEANGLNSSNILNKLSSPPLGLNGKRTCPTDSEFYSSTELELKKANKTSQLRSESQNAVMGESAVLTCNEILGLLFKSNVSLNTSDITTLTNDREHRPEWLHIDALSSFR